MELLVIIIVLSGLLIFSNVYYLRIVKQLTDKIMAGNYTNYAQAQVMLQDGNKHYPEQKIELTGEEELEELRKLNSMVAPPL